MKPGRMTITMGGLSIGIRSADSLPFLPCRRFLPFQADMDHPEITWRFRMSDPGPNGLNGNLPAMDDTKRRSGRSGELQAHLRQARKNPDWSTIELNDRATTILDFKKNRADIFFSRGYIHELDRHGIGPAMLSPFLPNFDACLLHASAVVRQGRAAVFLAPDEGGKTTAASLAPHCSVLGDDQILLRRISGGFQVSGTPWGLRIDSKLQAPLAGLFILEKARKFSLAPITPTDLISCLWQEGKDLMAILPRPLKKKALAIWCDLAAAVPAAKLSFPRDHIDWEELDGMMNG